MRSARLVLVFAFVLMGLACYIPSSMIKDEQLVLKPQGEQIRVVTKPGPSLEGEFLLVDEQSIYVLAGGNSGSSSNIIAIPYKGIRELKILGITNGQWLGYVLGFQIAPAVLLGVTYGIYTKDSGNGIALGARASIPGLLTALLYLTSTPPTPKLSGEMSFEKIRGLLKYARYPFLLDPDLEQKILDNLKKSSPRPILKQT